ncbi:MAG: hypothetical protein ABSB59_40670 [Streptosporangiaceae bacterium]
MTRLIASGLLPERAGQPVKAWVNISLADLMLLDGSSDLLAEWTARLRGRFAAHRAASAGGGGDNGGAWLEGDAAEAMVCDAIVAPVVTGDVDPDAFGDLVRLCVELDELSHGPHQPAAGAESGPGPVAPGPVAPGRVQPADADRSRMAWPATARSREVLEQAIVGKAAALLSGPGGLASFLRRNQLSWARLGHRLQRHRPGLDPPRGPAPRPALPVGRRLRPARLSLRRAPHDAQGPRRPHQPQGLRPAVPLSTRPSRVTPRGRGPALIYRADGRARMSDRRSAKCQRCPSESSAS